MPKTISPIDKHIGARVRQARMLVGMSQDKLGHALAISFQQVQKYENGTNRIGGSRMSQIATILRQPVGYFFDGAPGATNGVAQDAPADPMTEFGGTREGIALARAFNELPQGLKHTVAELITAIALHAHAA